MAFNYKTKQFFLLLIKVGLVVAAFYFIYHKLAYNPKLSLNSFFQNLTTLKDISMITIVVLFLLTILNWSFEISKWQTLVQVISPISFRQAYVQCLGSLTASLLTPNRVGEYGAKALYFEKPFRKKIIFFNLISNSAQMLITSIFGIIGSIYFLSHFEFRLNFNLLITVFVIISLVIFLLYLLRKTTWLTHKTKYVIHKIVFLKKVPKSVFCKVLLFSLMRYLLFSFQFYLILRLFNVEFPYFDAMMIISCMYFLSSVIPSIFIFDVIVKGGVALFLFGLVGVPEAVIVSVITLMWLFNFVLPSILGSYHVLTFKIPNPVS